MKQDTTHSYVFAGKDTYILEPSNKPVHIELRIKQEANAFDSFQPAPPVQFNTEPPMAQQLAHLIDVKPKPKAEPLYPWNEYVHGFTLFVLLITSALLTVKFYNFIHETRCNLRAKRLADAERLRHAQNINR